MTDNWWLKIRCPKCKSGERRYWPHSGCSKVYSNDSDIKIDIDGYIFCNGCHLREPLTNMNFACNDSGHSYKNAPPNLSDWLEVLQDLCSYDQKKIAIMMANISKMFLNKA